jgi:hypothetical protein
MLNPHFLSSNPKHHVLRFHELRCDVLEALAKAERSGDTNAVRRERNRLDYVDTELAEAVKRTRH